jgi:hypothetical protein
VTVGHLKNVISSNLFYRSMRVNSLFKSPTLFIDAGVSWTAQESRLFRNESCPHIEQRVENQAASAALYFMDCTSAARRRSMRQIERNTPMQAQPSAGRHFPIEASRLVDLTRDWILSGGGSSGPLRLRNPRPRFPAPLLLAALRPGRDLTVYSLPNTVDTALGQRAVPKALEMLARWKTEPAEPEGTSRSIAVYFYAGAELRVFDERVKYARRKFGAGEGLSSSRKPRVTSRRVTELAIVALD